MKRHDAILAHTAVSCRAGHLHRLAVVPVVLSTVAFVGGRVHDSHVGDEGPDEDWVDDEANDGRAVGLRSILPSARSRGGIDFERSVEDGGHEVRPHIGPGTAAATLVFVRVAAVADGDVVAVQHEVLGTQEPLGVLDGHGVDQQSPIELRTAVPSCSKESLELLEVRRGGRIAGKREHDGPDCRQHDENGEENQKEVGHIGLKVKADFVVRSLPRG